MTKLLLVRHGYSEANRLHICAGSGVDAPLTEEGQRQGDTVSEFIAKNYAVDKIYSSPLRRAQSTLKKLSELTLLPVERVDDLKEISCGDWEGKTFSEIEKIYPQAYFLWKNDFGRAIPTNGESFAHLQERGVNAITRLAEENDGKTIAIAAHAAILRAILSKIKQLPVDEVKDLPWVANASLSVVCYEHGEWTLEKENYVEYLGNAVTVLPPNV